jgi:adenylosuccinate synthase
MNTAVFGIQHGDEGKSRVVNYLAKSADIVVRFSGGGNAGHTFYHNGTKIIRHLIPSADFSILTQRAFLGSGMAINLENLLVEVKETEGLFPGSAKRIIVDPDAFVVLQKHIDQDKSENQKFGSTGQGITPCYTDRIARKGVKISQFLEDNSDITNELKKMGVKFRYSYEMHEEFLKSEILFEGSQSVMLEHCFGEYPMVTSGQCSLGGIYDAGFASAAPKKVIGVFKPYSTKVDGGAGKFLTEMPQEQAAIIQELGGEVGATTKRVRRVGYLDLVALKYAIVKGGINSLAITKMDILNKEKSIKVCMSYDKSPKTGSDFANSHPTYMDLPGWKDAKDRLQTSSFLNYVEKYAGVNIDYASSGTAPEDMIRRHGYKSTDRFLDLFDTNAV